MNRLVLLTFLIGNLIFITQAFQTINTLNFKKVFSSAKPYSDLSSAFYSVKGLRLLGENVENPAVSQQIYYIIQDILHTHVLFIIII